MLGLSYVRWNFKCDNLGNKLWTVLTNLNKIYTFDYSEGESQPLSQQDLYFQFNSASFKLSTGQNLKEWETEQDIHPLIMFEDQF
jgi:hypothetical protein